MQYVLVNPLYFYNNRKIIFTKLITLLQSIKHGVLFALASQRKLSWAQSDKFFLLYFYLTIRN